MAVVQEVEEKKEEEQQEAKAETPKIKLKPDAPNEDQLKDFEKSLVKKPMPMKPKGLDRIAEKMKSDIEAKKAKIIALQRQIAHEKELDELKG